MLIGVPKPLERKIPPVILSVLGVEDPASSGLSMDRTSAQKTSAGGSGSGRFYGCVEGQYVGLEGDVFDDFGNLGNLA